MIRFEAPIMLTGLVALSVDTAKYLREPMRRASSSVRTVFSTLTSIMRISEYGSFSLRTCFSAERFST